MGNLSIPLVYVNENITKNLKNIKRCYNVYDTKYKTPRKTIYQTLKNHEFFVWLIV